MQGKLFLLLSLIFTQISFTNTYIDLKKINQEQVNYFQQKLTKEIEYYDILGTSSKVAMVLAFGYYAYNYLKPSVVVVDKEKTIEEICRLYKEGKIALANRGFFAALKDIMIMGAFQVGMGYLQSKVFKDFNIYSIVREKTNIPLLFKALKNTAAVLDNKSEMFGAKLEISLGVDTDFKDVLTATTEDQKKAVQEIQAHLETVLKINNNQQSNIEILELKTIAATRSAMSDEVIATKLTNAVNFFNALTTDLEKVLAFMQYKAAYYSKQNMISESDEANDLISDLKELMSSKHTELNKILNNKSIGLLGAIFDYQRSLEEIIEMFNKIS